MKSFFNNLSSRFPFFANRPSALERAVRPSLKSRRLRMEPLENRALLAVDAFGVSASLAESNFEENWGPDPAPAAFSASVLATDAEVIDVSGVNATSAAASFSVQAETPEPVAPPSFDQLMESLGMIEIESLDDESDVASLSYLDEAVASPQTPGTQAEARQVVFYDSSAADFDASTLNLDDESVYYVDAANANAGDAESYSVTPRSGGGSSNSGGGSNSGGSSNSGGVAVDDPNDCSLTTYGSTEIFESMEFDGSGGSDQGPYFGFTTSDIPSGYWAYVRFKGGSAVYGEDYVVRCATVGEDGVVTPNMSYVSGGTNPDGSYDIYVYGPASYSVVPIDDNVLESNETVVAEFYLVDMQSGGADYDPTPILCDSFTATICQAPEFLTGNDANIINNDVLNLGFIYGKPEVGDVVSIPGGLNLETNGRAVTYSLESSESSEYFEINSATGVISWKALPPEGNYDFEITVKVADAEYPALYDVTDVDLTVGWANFILCVDQPVPGRPDPYVTENGQRKVGHAFWHIDVTPSLENFNYNEDYQNLFDNSWGFYPLNESNFKENVQRLLNCNLPSVLKNDTAHEMDVYAVFPIETEENFVSLLQFTHNLMISSTDLMISSPDYNLYSNNCATIALQAAWSAGIPVASLEVEYGNGSGYCPGQLGYDLVRFYRGSFGTYNRNN